MNVKSPCNNRCKLVNGKCASCGRDIDSIVNWRNLSDDEKRIILCKLGKSELT
jgi:predicted Fe-S protein YdhL (DUF1289 family)